MIHGNCSKEDDRKVVIQERTMKEKRPFSGLPKVIESFGELAHFFVIIVKYNKDKEMTWMPWK